ncbi:MAG TPA: MarC family protein [Solirubrobacteraceae bacterium]|nr:MarC family protein [Solirubrobacteraceae bacterium]
MDWTVFGETFVTLLVIMDPVAAAPIFIALTRQLSPGERQRAALRATLAAGVLVIGFALAGKALFDYLDVSVESLSIAGGLLLLLVALEMLRGMDEPTSEDTDIALVPLATPLVAGPGAIATVIILSEQSPDGAGRAGVILGIVAALLTVFVALLLADRLGRFLPPSLIAFLTRVFGLLLSAIAVQLVVDGVRGLV